MNLCGFYTFAFKFISMEDGGGVGEAGIGGERGWK